MLKFKKIELLTKTDKNPSVNQNTDAVTRRVQDMTCCAEKREIVLGGRGGAGCLQLGRVEMRKKKEKYGRIGSSERGYINFYRRLHRRTIPSVISSATLTANRARHRTELPFWIPRWFCRHFHRWIGHVTVRS